MAKLIIAIDKGDVQTRPYGNNFAIENDNITITFTTSAMRELVNDYRDHLIAEKYRYTDPLLCRLSMAITSASAVSNADGATAAESEVDEFNHKYEVRLKELIEEHKKNNPDTLWNNPSM